MKGYIADIESLTEDNSAFRRVLYTGVHLQLVLMSLTPGQDIGMETHATHDQFFRIEKGEGKMVIDGVSHKVGPGSAVVVPAGARHNLTNTGDKKLRLYTLYGPPNHLDHLQVQTKAEAGNLVETFDGVVTEA
jgi:mannose-6-phosphate isomerase-like protein (cupin superfamily)